MTWRERIALAKRDGGFSYDDKLAACSWECCAVGEVGIDPAYGDVFFSLGMEFCKAVSMDDLDRALGVLLRIEEKARSPITENSQLTVCIDT